MRNGIDHRPTREKIIQVTMDMIEKEGFQEVTIRRIAASAEVNVAAVNYHFGSKDALVTEALQTLTCQLRETFRVLQREEIGEGALTEFMTGYLKVISAYPDVMRSIISHAIQNRPAESHAEYIAFIQSEGLHLIKRNIREIRPDLSESMLSYQAVSMLGGFLMPIIMGNAIEEIAGINLQSEEAQHSYVSMVMENIKGKGGSIR